MQGKTSKKITPFAWHFEAAKSLLKMRHLPMAEKNSLFLKKSSVRFFQKQAVFFRKRPALAKKCALNPA
jgi:hypothetical protein